MKKEQFKRSKNSEKKEVKMMKKIFVAFLAVVMTIGFGSMASAVDQNFISFNDSQLGWIDVYSFDWNVGNALSVGSVPPADLPTSPDVHPFTLYFQAQLNSFNDSGGNPIQNTGLNTDYEVTIIAAFGEVATTFGGPTANFFFDPTNTTNYGVMFYDTNVNADNLAGTGFHDGTSIMEGVVIDQDATGSVITGGNFTVDLTAMGESNVVQFDQFNNDDYPGIGSQTGSGTTNAVIDVDPNSVDGNFLSPSAPVLIMLELLTNSSNVVPFLQQDPSQQFIDWLTSMFVIPTFGDCTGAPTFPCEANVFDLVNGSNMDGLDVDFQFQADANSAIRLQAIPEPGTIFLLGFGLLGLGAYYRRRKN
jgi:hypothetical protein